MALYGAGRDPLRRTFRFHFTPLLAAIPAALLGDRANGSPVDPNMTFTKLPDQIIWETARNRPPKTVEQALLWGKSSEPGLYYYLVKWYVL